MSYPHEEDEMTGTTRIPVAEITGFKGLKWLQDFVAKTLAGGGGGGSADA